MSFNLISKTNLGGEHFPTAADAEAGKRTWAGHESDFGEVAPSFAIFGEFAF